MSEGGVVSRGVNLHNVVGGYRPMSKLSTLAKTPNEGDPSDPHKKDCDYRRFRRAS